MFRHSDNGIISYSFESFNSQQVQVEVITRNGGISPQPWDSLNLGGTVGDDPSNVKTNRICVIQTFNLDANSIYDVWQVHSADWIHATQGRPQSEPHKKADIIITDKPELVLMMRFADCVPIFIYDPVRKAIGIAHAGWLGTSKDVAGTLVRAMSTQFGSKPGDLLAAIGPAICLEHYPVGKEVIDAIEKTIDADIQYVVKDNNGKKHIDLKKCNALQFRNAGLIEIENSEMCTACDFDNWFSHRGGNGKTGRFGAFIKLAAS
jgi:YfiH family protein